MSIYDRSLFRYKERRKSPVRYTKGRQIVTLAGYPLSERSSSSGTFIRGVFYMWLDISIFIITALMKIIHSVLNLRNVHKGSKCYTVIYYFLSF